MPLVRKRQREDGEKTNEQVKRRKKCKEYTEFENIGYKNDHWHTIFRSLPDNIKKVTRTISRDVGSFLNGDGGILCFGVRKTGVIYGEEINRKEEDNLRLLIDEIFKKMSPHVPTDTYRVTFTPVRGSSFNRQYEATKLQVLEIRVAPGDPFALYEDLNHEVYLRKGDQPYGPLKPHEIKRHTVQQLTKQLESHKDFAKLFEKPEQSEVKDKENSSVTVKSKKSSSSSSGSLSPVKKPPLKSNQSSSSKSSAKVTQEKSSKSLMLIPSLLSKTERSSESASHKTQVVPSKAETASSSSSSSGTKDHPIVLSSGESDHDTPLHHSLRSQTKEHPIVLSSGESDHEAPLPSARPQTKTSEPKAEQPVEKPKATIKPLVIKVTAPTVSQAKCLPGEEQVAPVKKPDSSLPPVEKVSQPTVALAKCLKVAPSKKNAAPIKPPPLMKTTVKLPKQRSVAKASTKKAIARIVGPSGIPPPPPRPPPSFSIYNHHQVPRPHYYAKSYSYHHNGQNPYYQHQRHSGDYSYDSYPIWGESFAPSHSIHPLATSYSAPYYRYH